MTNPEGMLTQGLQVRAGIESTIGNVVGLIIKIEVLFDSLYGLQKDLLIRLVARIGLGEQRNAVLVGHHGKHELFEIPAEIFIVAVGDLDGSEILIGVVILAMDAETGGVSMQEVGAELELLHDFHDNTVEQVCGTVIVDPVKGPQKNIIVQMVRGDSGSKQLFCREVVEEPREEIEPSFIESQSVQEHGHDNF